MNPDDCLAQALDRARNGMVKPLLLQRGRLLIQLLEARGDPNARATLRAELSRIDAQLQTFGVKP